jgi:hypothetical protein
MQTTSGVRRRHASGAALEAIAGRAILANKAFGRDGMKSGVLTMEFTVSRGQAERGEALEILQPIEFRRYLHQRRFASFGNRSASIPTAPR